MTEAEFWVAVLDKLDAILAGVSGLEPSLVLGATMVGIAAALLVALLFAKVIE